MNDWGKPDLIIVDGGKAQVNAFSLILQVKKTKIPVVGIAKGPDRLIVYDQAIRLQGTALNFVQKIRDEAHRFARSYHHNLISKSIIS
jgi:excinuclease ABC subunit C